MRTTLILNIYVSINKFLKFPYSFKKATINIITNSNSITWITNNNNKYYKFYIFLQKLCILYYSVKIYVYRTNKQEAYRTTYNFLLKQKI